MKLSWCILLLLLLSPLAFGQADTTNPPIDSLSLLEVAPPTSVIASDYKYDNANKLNLNWVPSIDEMLDIKGLPIGNVVGYKIYRKVDDGELVKIAELMAGKSSYTDETVSEEHSYSYAVAAVSKTENETMSFVTAPLMPEREWIDFHRTNLFIIALVISGAVFYFIRTASKGKKLFVRRIAGLEAVDEAIGRATEMGRPILFIPGIHDMDDVQTLAAITILGKVAEQVADYDTQIRMPVSRSLVMTAARETIKAAYQTAGRPDAYSDDMVNYITDEQFGYVAAVDGIMVREKPATIFLLGAFFAESLILAETGNSVGAIQIAGTARPAQLPFFIAACDFTLIGEELFAASAYLSGEPKMLGSLKGQDVGKAIAMAAVLVGVLSLTVGYMFEIDFLTGVSNGIADFFKVN